MKHIRHKYVNNMSPIMTQQQHEGKSCTSNSIGSSIIRTFHTRIHTHTKNTQETN